MATRKRHIPEQVERKLATADRMLGDARMLPTTAATCGPPSKPTTGGGARSAGLKADDDKRLKNLERENAMLERLLANVALTPS